MLRFPLSALWRCWRRLTVIAGRRGDFPLGQ